MLILDLSGIGYHAVVVFGLGKKLLFKSVLGHCEIVHITTTAEDRVTLSWSNGNSSWEPGYYTHKNI